MSNSFGTLFRFSTFGESHGPALGVVIDGCPAGLELEPEHIQAALDRRRPGQSSLSTARSEADRVEVLSGVYLGRSTGSPIALLVRNTDARPQDYQALTSVYRPSHADRVYDLKYGHRDPRGGGRSSARETLARVAAGAVAQRLLAHLALQQEQQPPLVLAWTSQIGDIELAQDYRPKSLAQVDAHVSRCPHPDTAASMAAAILEAQAQGDSLGGIVSCVVQGLPAGWGQPVYDKLSARLGYAMLGINAVKGFEVGSGFAGSRLRGSQHNDSWHSDGGQVRAASNHAGGVLGGISTGEELYFRVAFKPTATIALAQNTVNAEGENVVLQAKGRHDPCVLPRAVPIVEAMTACVLADFALLRRAEGGQW